MGYFHQQKNGCVTYTTAKGHGHIIDYSYKNNKMIILWGEKFRIKEYKNEHLLSLASRYKNENFC